LLLVRVATFWAKWVKFKTEFFGEAHSYVEFLKINSKKLGMWESAKRYFHELENFQIDMIRWTKFGNCCETLAEFLRFCTRVGAVGNWEAWWYLTAYYDERDKTETYWVFGQDLRNNDSRKTGDMDR
jgi:hypothetical protein